MTEYREIMTISTHTHRISSLAVLENGLLDTGDSYGIIKIWNITNDYKEVMRINAYTFQVAFLKGLENGLLASFGLDDDHIRRKKIWKITKEKKF
jgi:WD40 repeat protein